MALHHTKFMHDVKGVGELVVFSLSKKFDTDKYFRIKMISDEDFRFLLDVSEECDKKF